MIVLAASLVCSVLLDPCPLDLEGQPRATAGLRTAGALAKVATSVVS